MLVSALSSLRLNSVKKTPEIGKYRPKNKQKCTKSMKFRAKSPPNNRAQNRSNGAPRWTDVSDPVKTLKKSPDTTKCYKKQPDMPQK